MFKSSSAKLHFNVKDSNACLKLKTSYIKCKRFKSCKFSILGKGYMDNEHAQILSIEQMFQPETHSKTVNFQYLGNASEPCEVVGCGPNVPSGGLLWSTKF